MRRSEAGFVAAVAGAVLVAAGAAAFHPTWLPVAGGAVALLAGLLSLGTRGSLVLAVVGGWMVLSAFLPWAAAPWNLMLGGLAVVALGFLSGAAGAAAPDG